MFVGILICISVYTDYKYYKVLNKIVYTSMLFGVILSAIFYGYHEALFSVFRIFIVILILFPLYILKFLGAGDIKLLSAIGTFLNFIQTGKIIIYSIIAGGIIGVILLLTRRNSIQQFTKLITYLKTCFYTFSIKPYNIDKQNNNGIFRFSYAIFAGFSFFLFNTL
jgi:prepilin peptidase CpaA